MGGNVVAMNKYSKVSTEAQRINLREIPRELFRKKVLGLFKYLNSDFYSQMGYYLWDSLDLLESGYLFNGSTSYIMNPDVKTSEILKYRDSIGDIDIMVPDKTKEDLWIYLDSLESNDLMNFNSIKYAGSNKPTIQSIGHQINSVFVINFAGTSVPVQVDFEFSEFINSAPTEWSRFSHSSSFEDAKHGIKAVHHKFLLRSIVGSSSIREDIVISTPKSTPDNITLTKAKEHLQPRMLKFSVDRGIRIAYEPMFDDNGDNIVIDGKDVYRPLSTSESTFYNTVCDIFELTFDQHRSSPDLHKIWSFVGVIELMKKYLSEEQINDTTKRYTELLWGFKRQRGQELERNDPDGDLAVKNAGYQYYINALAVPDERSEYIGSYYKDYRVTVVDEPIETQKAS